MPLDAPHLIGAVSTIFWGLMLVVTLKYVVLILRADNRGEGGIMALTALAMNAAGTTPRRRTALLLLGVFGAALFYGDSVITPAISVLGAAEGPRGRRAGAEDVGLPISVGVLIGLFVVQRHGTGASAARSVRSSCSGSRCSAATGVWQIAQRAGDPAGARSASRLRLPARARLACFAAVGAIVLALTGAEALYADMGHFGRRPIQLAWIGLVLPALALNYMGQGALLMRDPGGAREPVLPPVPAGVAAARGGAGDAAPR